MGYKELSQVEWVFRKLKDVLETRPIYHHDPRAVPGPCLCCCLGLLARPTLGEKAKASQAPLFHRRGLDSPPTVHVVEADVGGTKHRGVTAGNRQARQILSALKISSLEPWKSKKRTSKTPT
ncbi:hypothetical protein A7K72_10420 [Candidatus Methylacidiphilum fumarolicum]|uniref:Transposase n=1 Tax=Candidatus Methylacidiphilum fumarolicum TaxID=591154 RepID=A0ABN8XI79_9BACT|nr:hypothetical protein [Candidatus Methylacidiphilum fumarolicum]TFE71698.1 hypothetical protein A7K72_10420 [Candidatus Methylacidiphilum fumarolicum]TFE76686.1 hypothetical protein A7D33_08605 [Candidatus Methylacidiphilum fumarolicum]CAI9085883.1 protein of unknown function [Candidatus Methylacidiphilum fumarolicum]